MPVSNSSGFSAEPRLLEQLRTMLTECSSVLGDMIEAHAPRDVDERTHAVRQAHAEIDAHTSRFALETGVRCPEDCGACCLSPNVESTVVDALPLAEAIVRSGAAGEVLERIAARGDDDLRCVLYEHDRHDPKRGRCTMYAHRPSICRLFGFAGRRNADGDPQFTPCRVHAEASPAATREAERAVAERRIALPIFAELAGQVSAAAPAASQRPEPINHALREAVMMIGLQAQLAALQVEGEREGANVVSSLAPDQCDHDGDGEKPSTPHTPRDPRAPRRHAA